MSEGAPASRPKRTLAPGGLAVAAASSAVAFILLAMLVSAGTTIRFDAAVATALPGSGGPAVIGAARFISFFGSLPGALLVTFPLFILLLRRRTDAAAGLALCFLLSPIALLFKNMIGRPRPPASFLHFDPISSATLSFPSAHAALAAGVYGWLLFLLVGARLPRTARLAGSLFFLALIGLIGLSRLYLGAHYATDVVGGWLMALAFLSLLAMALRPN